VLKDFNFSSRGPETSKIDQDMDNQQSELLGSLPESFIRPPLPLDEPQRLIALKRYDLLDTPPEQAFDRIARLAAGVLGMPISLITLIDATRQWFKSRHGLDVPWTRREVAFCSYTILNTEPLVVVDAAADDRFADNPLVSEDPNIRFYAGAPLVTPDGHVLGTLCVIDRSPHPEFSNEQQRLLQDLAELVMTEIEARSANLALRQKVREHQETERRLQWSLAETETLLREVHHRVKNNLQLADTLLALEIHHTPAVAEHLRDLRYRMYCLGMVHQMLMQSADLTTIKVGEYLCNLCQSLAASNTDRQGRVTVNVTAEPRDLAFKIDFAISLGLLVSELVTNAYKHAFPPDQPGTIDVSLTIIGEGKACLVVSDDGIGMPASPSPVPVGQQIIAELVDQLDGEMTMNQHQGTDITVTFPCPFESPC
jgi:two-component sensor histidine kinase